jgi:hypothetical protein
MNRIDSRRNEQMSMNVADIAETVPVVGDFFLFGAKIRPTGRIN